MSSTVDNKVVQMTFDNNKFERGAEETLSTLDKLKRALNFDDNNRYHNLPNYGFQHIILLGSIFDY